MHGACPGVWTGTQIIHNTTFSARVGSTLHYVTEAAQGQMLRLLYLISHSATSAFGNAKAMQSKNQLFVKMWFCFPIDSSTQLDFCCRFLMNNELVYLDLSGRNA